MSVLDMMEYSWFTIPYYIHCDICDIVTLYTQMEQNS